MTDTDFFAIGSEVCVKPVVGDDITGEVVSYEQKSRILVLKMPASNKKSHLNDLSTIFMSKVMNVSLIREPDVNSPPPEPLPQQSISALRKRYDKNFKERCIIGTAKNDKVCLDAQQIFLRIAKCSLDTSWSEQGDIIVMGEVAVVPPYTSNSVRACKANHQIIDNTPPTKMMKYVAKMVEKHYEETKKGALQQQQPASRNAAKEASTSAPTQTPPTAAVVAEKQQQQHQQQQQQQHQQQQHHHHHQQGVSGRRENSAGRAPSTRGAAGGGRGGRSKDRSSNSHHRRGGGGGRA